MRQILKRNFTEIAVKALKYTAYSNGCMTDMIEASLYLVTNIAKTSKLLNLNKLKKKKHTRYHTIKF